MQELEAGLSGRSSIYNAGPAPGPGPRKAGHSASSSSSASENTAPSGQKSDKSEPKSDSKFGGNVRSGSEYYSKWDKYASEAERKLAVQQAEEEQREEKKLKGLIKEASLISFLILFLIFFSGMSLNEQNMTFLLFPLLPLHQFGNQKGSARNPPARHFCRRRPEGH